ncbi:MAG TPA: hypothetical protein VJU87_03250 [Gemmatimonadaceae bacterium]|nr:hypothetical protein [Gemmatimonadaceae bacterium]
MTTSQSPRQPLSATAAGGPHGAPIPAAGGPHDRAPSARVLAFPVALGVIITCFALLTQQAVLQRTFIGVGAALLLWSALLWRSARSGHRSLAVVFTPRRNHWVQACAQFTLIAYWAAHTPIIAALLPFLVAQLAFAYAVDSLLSWSRRDVYALGFGPFPVIFSINLFLVFRPEWFYWQFVLIALGFAAKELIRWQREGRPAHIFNPSSFPLAVFSLVLLLTGTTDVTFGNIIANTIFDTPHIHLAIFLVALPGEILFGVAPVTIAAAVALYAIGAGYLAATGTYLFYDAYIPPAVFIGMTLLVTDPSTSPRTLLGRLWFGVLYAVGTAILFVLLERAGAPTFYDKLLPIPLMNLMVRGIDRAARAPALAALDPARWLRALTPQRTYVVYTSVWVAIFIPLIATRAVGDAHPGEYLPFWQNACAAGSSRACQYVGTLTTVYCVRGSGWACNYLGILKRRVGAPAEPDFRRACALGYPAGCENANAGARVGSFASGPPAVRDLPIVLSGTKPTLHERDPARLYALACDQGWPGACGAGAR